MKPGRKVLAQILDYLWMVIANDNAQTEFHPAPGDRLLLQLGMWLKRPLSVRCQAVHRGCCKRAPLEVGGDHRIRIPRLSSRPVRSGRQPAQRADRLQGYRKVLAEAGLQEDRALSKMAIFGSRVATC